MREFIGLAILDDFREHRDSLGALDCREVRNGSRDAWCRRCGGIIVMTKTLLQLLPSLLLSLVAVAVCCRVDECRV